MVSQHFPLCNFIEKGKVIWYFNKTLLSTDVYFRNCLENNYHFTKKKSRNARILHLALSLIFLLGEVLFLLVFLFVPEPDVLLHTCILSYLNAYILAYLHTCILAYLHKCAYLHTCIIRFVRLGHMS